MLVLRPSAKQSPLSQQVHRVIGEEFRGLVSTAIGVLLLTGIILSVSRLTAGAAGLAYAVVLTIKIALSLYMFYVVRFLHQRSYPGNPGTETEGSGLRGWWSRMQGRCTSATAVLVIGMAVIGLAYVLDLLFERGLVK